MPKSINIFDYTWYREYLRDYYEHSKSTSRYFSYRQFAARAGFNSFSLYRNIVEGIKNLTPRYLPGFIKALSLKPEEARYFELMVQLDRSKSGGGRREIFEQMLKLMPKKTRRLKSSQKQIFTTWRHSAVLQSLSVLNIRENFKDISKFIVPHVKTVDVKESIRLLKELGLIAPDSRGYLRPSNTDLVGGKEVGAVYINDFQLKMLELAVDALEELDAPERYYRTETAALSESCYRTLEKKIKDFHQELINVILNDKAKADKIVQMNLQFFPLCK